MGAVKHIQKTTTASATHEKSKLSKPLMERRRRERINRSLDELKQFLIEALRKDSACHSKLEKADILEMTVHYIKTLRTSGGLNPNQNSMGSYIAGYNQARTNVVQYLSTPQGVTMPDPLKTNLMINLNQGLQKLNPVQPNPFFQQQMPLPFPNSHHLPVRQQPSPVNSVFSSKSISPTNSSSSLPGLPQNDQVLQAQNNLKLINQQIIETQQKIKALEQTRGNSSDSGTNEQIENDDEISVTDEPDTKPVPWRPW